MDKVAKDVFIHFKLETVQILEMTLKLSSLYFNDFFVHLMPIKDESMTDTNF